MAKGKVRSLQVRPIRSADLAFETAGVIAAQGATAKLGQSVSAFDVQGKLYDRLLDTDRNDPGRLSGDSKRLRSLLAAEALFSLRNGMFGVVLDQAITQREVAYTQKYKHETAIAQAVQDVYSATDAGKIQRLTALRDALAAQRKGLADAYTAEKMTGVVKEVPSKTTQKGKTITDTLLTPVAMRNGEQRIEVRDTPVTANHTVKENQVIPQSYSSGAWRDLVVSEFGFKSQRADTDHDLVIETVSRTHDFRFPLLESSIGELRSQIDLLDEMLQEKIASLRAPDTAFLLKRELLTLDLEVSKHQIRFSETFLVAPFSGVVTAIYKDVGEAVQAGEPVVRIDDASRVLIVGLVQAREALQIGRAVRITANNVYETRDVVTIDGTLATVRGHDSDDDEWDVIVEADNRSRLPINFHFDRDTTGVEFR